MGSESGIFERVGSRVRMNSLRYYLRAEENIISTFSFHIWNRSKILLSLVQSNLGPDSNNLIAIFNVLC